jgi:hypothetical protein
MTKERPENDDPTVRDNLLYILSEMERAVEVNDICWTASQREEILRRLGQIAGRVASASLREDPSSAK